MFEVMYKVNTKLITNKNGNCVGDILKSKIKAKSKIKLLTSYFTIYALEDLMQQLNKISDIKILLDTDTISENESSLIIGNDGSELLYRNQLQQHIIAKKCAMLLKDIGEIRRMSDSNLMPPFLTVENNNQTNCSLIGTKIFNTIGLGTTHSEKLQAINFFEDEVFTKQYTELFDMLWNNTGSSSDIKNEVLSTLERFYKENTGQYLYYVTLYNIFSEYLESIEEDRVIKSKTGFKDTEIWNKLYKFQKDGVIGAIDKLEKYNGCVIADSVGLGKTFEALAVIKYYELRNDRVLVLCPKKLRENWLMYTQQNDRRNLLANDRFNYDVLNHTDLSRLKGLSGDLNLEMINWSNYDLIVIDESHNFRNNQARNDRETRYSRLMNEVIKKGVKTKVLMLSATPVNNKMTDLKNQIAFITEGKDAAMSNAGIESIDDTLRQAQTAFNRWQKFSEDKRTTEHLLELLHLDYFKLLDAVTIARSRKHIEKYYDMADIGKFPTRLQPINVYAEIDIKNEFPEIKRVSDLINRLNLSAYSPIQYVLPQKQEEYSKKYDKKVKGGSVFKQVDRESSLVHLMRVNLLKRMESSIVSFGKTIGKLLDKIEALIDTLKIDQSSSTTTFSINEIDLEDETLSEYFVGGKVKVLLQDVDKIRWAQDLEEDRNNLLLLLATAARINPERDAKLKSLKQYIENKINNPINPGNKKVIVFTAFSDTAEYLYNELSLWLKEKYFLDSALVTGSGDNKTTLQGVSKDLNSILINFSPISKEREKLSFNIQGEIDVLIATDCISEGQNLQDCDYLINYDIHWNPVRIIQRFGRIDRLGSKNDVIQLVNFWPNLALDEYINLETRVTGRMFMMDVSATGEENLIIYDEGKPMNDLPYRARQLKQLQETVLNLEDMSGALSITDITLNDFKMDLLDYIEQQGNELNLAPKGMFATVSGTSLDLEPGVIFTLRLINEQKTLANHSALNPYFLLYLNLEGQVILAQHKSKQILDIYRKLAFENTELHQESISYLKGQTQNYENMGLYKQLYDSAIGFIENKVKEQGVASLFSLGSTGMHLGATNEDFEMISYLIIK